MTSEIECESQGVVLRAGRLSAADDSFAGDAGTPCIVMAHGLGGTRAADLKPFRQRFAAASFQLLCCDYRSFGESEGHPRQVVSMPGQQEGGQ